MAGCAYHTRCPLALERCATDVPPLEPLAPSGPTAPPHLRACWAPAESVFAHVAETAPTDPVTAAPAEVAVAGEVPDAGTPVVVADAVQCDFKVRGAGGKKVIVHALRGVDLSVMAGEAVSIVGESGSGKSTLLRVLAGLTKASGGTARVTGAVQMVFQDAGSSLTPWMSVGEILRERLHPLRLGRTEAGAQVEEALEAIGLPRALTSAKPAQLSGGQRQRVALARATIIAPAVLLCDEPTSSLDASLAASVLNLIRQMRRELGMAVIFVTHDISVARLMGDRVGVMREGELVEIGPTEDVLSRPQHPYTRALLSAVPEIDLETGEAA